MVTLSAFICILNTYSLCFVDLKEDKIFCIDMRTQNTAFVLDMVINQADKMNCDNTIQKKIVPKN